MINPLKMVTLVHNLIQDISVPSISTKNELIDQLAARARVLPVITIEREEDILPMADALAAGGIRTLEVTLRSPLGLDAIQTLRRSRPDLCIGAGTVLDEDMMANAVAAGAQFIVSPGTTQPLLRAGLHCPVPLLPGIASPSELMLGYALGYRRFKLFPAEISGGIPMLRALNGPFGDARFCPTGGVSPRNLKEYSSQANVMCVGGSWMLNNAWIRAGQWHLVQEASAEAIRLLD